MATLVISFGKSPAPGGGGRNLPIADGSEVRTEVITIDNTAGGGTTTISAEGNEDIVDLYPGADCWVQIAPAPSAVSGAADCWFLAAGIPKQFWVDAGEKVSVAVDV